jgi:hypothetical protein
MPPRCAAISSSGRRHLSRSPLVLGALDVAVQTVALHDEATHGPVRLARALEERVGDGRRRVTGSPQKKRGLGRPLL